MFRLLKSLKKSSTSTNVDIELIKKRAAANKPPIKKPEVPVEPPKPSEYIVGQVESLHNLSKKYNGMYHQYTRALDTIMSIREHLSDIDIEYLRHYINNNTYIFDCYKEFLYSILYVKFGTRIYPENQLRGMILHHTIKSIKELGRNTRTNIKFNNNGIVLIYDEVFITINIVDCTLTVNFKGNGCIIPIVEFEEFRQIVQSMVYTNKTFWALKGRFNKALKDAKDYIDVELENSYTTKVLFEESTAMRFKLAMTEYKKLYEYVSDNSNNNGIKGLNKKFKNTLEYYSDDIRKFKFYQNDKLVAFLRTFYDVSKWQVIGIEADGFMVRSKVKPKIILTVSNPNHRDEREISYMNYAYDHLYNELKEQYVVIGNNTEYLERYFML